jgi:hypothetical protein
MSIEGERKSKKAEFVNRLHAEKRSIVGSALLGLLNLEIERMRDELEDSELDRVQAFQGAVGALRGLKELVEDGYPELPT